MRKLLLPLVMATSVVPAYSQTEVLKVLAGDEMSGDQFGGALAISGGKGLAGSTHHEGAHGTGPLSGSAYLFDLATGQQLLELLPVGATSQTRFGFAVALDGDLALVGAPATQNSALPLGAAYMFNASTGVQLTTFQPNDAWPRDLFGASVAFGGSKVLVGAPSHDLNAVGAAYLFNQNTGSQIVKITESVFGTPSAFFGRSVAIAGNLGLVGAPGAMNNGVQTGAAYLYDLSTGQQLTKLVANNGASQDHFGSSVAISSIFSGITIIIGAPEANSGLGRAYLFNTFGQELHELNPTISSGQDRMGTSVAISGDIAIAGAPLSANASGRVHYFDVATGASLGVFEAGDAAGGDYLGLGLALDGQTALLGAPLDDDLGGESGSVYEVTFSRTVGGPFCFGDGTGNPCPCADSTILGAGCANITGFGATLSGAGHASIAHDSFELDVAWVPGSKPGLIFRGSNQLAGGLGIQVADGLFCVSGQSIRSQVQVTSAGGTTAFSNFQGAPFGATSLGAGVTTNYQYWYRDPGNTCSGQGFNYSNAWEVVWLP